MRTTAGITLALMAGALAGCASQPAAYEQTAGGAVVTSVSSGELALRQTMRKLWSDHVVWTRQYIVSAIADDPSAQSAATRLMKNQEEIGNAMVPYYGSAAGTRLTDLLKQHIQIAVDVVAAAKASDNAKLTEADRRWHANASDIATFLSSANPNWPRQTLLDMLNEHLALTTQEATARLQKRWDDDIATFDKVFTQAMHMADALSEGIAKQFPAKV